MSGATMKGRENRPVMTGNVMSAKSVEELDLFGNSHCHQRSGIAEGRAFNGLRKCSVRPRSFFGLGIRHMEDITIINGTLVICSDGSFYMPDQAMEKWPWIRKYMAECFWNVA